MARKKRSLPKGILPSFSYSARLCYFLDLARIDPNNKPMTIARKNLMADAISKLNIPIHSQLVVKNTNDGEIIKSAIEFINQAAENERRKEISIIEQYIKHLQEQLPEGLLKKHGSDLNKLIQSLKEFSANPANGNMDNFYIDLTICLNTIRNNIDMFKDRLNQLLDKNRVTFNDLTADQYIFRAGSDIEGVLKNAVGIKEREVENSFASIIQDMMAQYIVNHIDLNINEHIPALLVGLTIDFLHFLQSKKIPGLDLNDLPKEILEKYYEEWEEEGTYFTKGIEENSIAFKQTLQDIEEEMGFKQIKKNSKEWEDREKEIKRKTRTRKNDKENPNRIRKKILNKSNKAYQNQLKGLDWIHFDVKANRHGTIYEIIQSVIGPALKVRGHAATDIISVNLGTIKGSIDPKFTDMIYNSLIPMKEEIENYEKKVRKDRFDDLKEDFEVMNGVIRGTLNELDGQLKKLNIPEKLFIYHDSLKLYIRIDEGKIDEFHGRNLQAFSALDRLYSMSTDFTMIDPNLLYGIILNLSELAIGHNLKGTVENYLSIFAGLLMFDDIQNIAMEASKNAVGQLSYSNLSTIHMYLLNDIYVPGSYLLSHIANALQDGYTQINLNNSAAKVTILTGGADATINNYLINRGMGMDYDPDDWQWVANDVSTGTNIQITFLKGFLNFIQDLQNGLAQ